MSVATRWANWEAAGRPAGALAGPLGTITFPITPLAGRVEIALGADPDADPATWLWLDITQWIRFADGVSISRGRPDEASTVDASQAQFTLDNTGGRFSRRNPLSPYYRQLSQNTPVRIGVDPGDGVHYRFHGFVNEWPTRWADTSGSDSFVPVTCSGVLRRLGHGGRVHSAIYGTMAGLNSGDIQPFAYWPAEDGADADFIAPWRSGISTMSNSGATMAADSSIVGSEPLPVWPPGSTGYASVPNRAPTGQWMFQAWMNIPSLPGSTTDYLEVRSSGTGTRFTAGVEPSPLPAALHWQIYNSAGTLLSGGVFMLLDGTNGPTQADFFGHWWLWTIGAQDIGGGNTTYWLDCTNGQDSFAFTQVVLAATPGALVGHRVYGQGQSAGHFAYYDAIDFTFYQGLRKNARALGGWAGEQAHQRMIRLCRAEGLDFTCTSATSAPMGAQTSGTLLDNLRECEAADMGVLYEHEFGLGYQSLDDRLNTSAVLKLDFDAGHIAETPEPADDDQRLVNRYTATRSGGTDATEQDDKSVAQAGVFAGSGSSSLFTDDQPRDVARWKVHLGTVDEDRWPSIPIRLTGTPDLIPAWTSLPYGARMTVANPPGEVAPDTIDAIVEGWTETIQPPEWAASLNTTPASPYRVGKIADESGDHDPFLGWLESDSCTLAADVSTADLSWQITADPLWTTNGDDFPVDVRVGGEVVTVSACSGVSAPQTWTIQARGVNGATLAHHANDAIELVHPIILVP